MGFKENKRIEGKTKTAGRAWTGIEKKKQEKEQSKFNINTSTQSGPSDSASWKDQLRSITLVDTVASKPTA